MRKTPSAVVTLASSLHAQYMSGHAVAITWLNHYSAMRVLADRDHELASFDVVGIDGKLLQLLVRGTRRTSGDLLVPFLLPLVPGAAVAIVGGSQETLGARCEAVRELLAADGRIVLSYDGFSGLPPAADLAAAIEQTGTNIVLLGLGAGLQETYASIAKKAFTNGGLAITCGGLLDQLLYPSYYPRWAYPLHLNWLVRLAREPRRLWRRYTMDACTAIRRRRALREAIRSLPGTWT
jgi:UDP-N-acetyl-D-mannosaminuronic acid transferase (WecB/TagA/CpsF family)